MQAQLLKAGLTTGDQDLSVRFGASTMKAKVIRVEIKQVETDFLRGTSRDHAGIFVAGKTREQVLAGVPKALKALYSMEGENVVIHEAEPVDPDTPSWVVIPVGGELKESA